MPAFLTVCVFLALCAGCSPGAVAPSAQSAPGSVSSALRVISWNVFLLPWPVGWFHKPECRAKAMAPVLDDFDVIALQETFDEATTRELAQTLLPTHPHQLLSLPRGWGKLNGGLTLLSRHRIVSHKVIVYRDCQGMMSDCRARRGAVLARLSTPQGELDVVLTHLNSGAHQARLARLGQLEQLREEMAAAGMGTGERPLLLVGDLNVDGIAFRARSSSDDLSSWGAAMRALGNECVGCEAESCEACDPLPHDVFWQAHGPWEASAHGTQEANTYLCLKWDLKGCGDTSDPSRWRERGRLDYALWWPGSRGTMVPARIAHQSMSGEACGLSYLSDHRAVQIELRVP